MNKDREGSKRKNMITCWKWRSKRIIYKGESKGDGKGASLVGNLEKKQERNATNLNSRLHEVESHRQSFPHENIWIVGGGERPLQLLQLPCTEVGSNTHSTRLSS